jgi:hypothetical protein
LKEMMDDCITHVIGSSGGTNSTHMNTPTIGTPQAQRSRIQNPLGRLVQPSTPPTNVDTIPKLTPEETGE